MDGISSGCSERLSFSGRTIRLEAEATINQIEKVDKKMSRKYRETEDVMLAECPVGMNLERMTEGRGNLQRSSVFCMITISRKTYCLSAFRS